MKNSHTNQHNLEICQKLIKLLEEDALINQTRNEYKTSDNLIEFINYCCSNSNTKINQLSDQEHQEMFLALELQPDDNLQTTCSVIRDLFDAETFQVIIDNQGITLDLTN